ncbi:hypothetical protein BGX31_010063 [Mortierella sp. GBA43]|nr:hypothetical protein BGX31_010063 [Mortierella sp. GBA43]
MLSRSIVPAFKGALSLHQSLELCNTYLDSAYKTTDRDIALLLCHDAEAALGHAKSVEKRLPDHLKDTTYQIWRSGIAAAYVDLGKLLEFQGYGNEAKLMCKKTEKWGGTIHDHGRLAHSSIPGFIAQSPKCIEAPVGDPQNSGSVDTSLVKKGLVAAAVSSNIFPQNIQLQSIDVKLPEPDERLINTPQLACCLGLLQAIHSPANTLEPRAYKWLQVIEKDADEQERLHAMSSDVIRAFKSDEIKDAKVIAEVVYLAPVLTKDQFRDLLRDFHSAIEQSTLLDTYRVAGLAQLIQGADSGYLDADDLVKILDHLSNRLKATHRQSSSHTRQLTLAVSHVLDAMAETQVKDVDREKIHEPLMEYLNELKKSSDPFLVYQAAYAYQALLYVPDDETLWQAALRRTGHVFKGISGLVSAVKSVDLEKLIEGLDSIQKGLAGVSKIAEIAFTAYKDVKELAQSGQGFLEGLKDGLSFKRQSAWYPALRGADTLIHRGELTEFKRLVCEAPCRYDAAFQWGVCQRLGEMAGNPMWDAVTRRSAISFLGEIYQNDNMWGQHANVKQLILNILMQLGSPSTGSSPSAGSSSNTLQCM